MSKLRAALEAAKRQRAAKLGGDPRPTPRSRRQAAASAAPVLPDDQQLTMAAAQRITVDRDILRANRLLTEEGPHRAESAYRMLRTRVMQKMRSNGWQTLGVSSIGPNEGKTLTAINLAISIAAEVGQEVLLVDLDLRRPAISKAFGIRNDQFRSLRDYFDDPSQEIDEIIVSPGIDRLGCILSALPLERPSDVLASPRGKQLFEDLKRRLSPNTVVVVDLPPLLTVDDALAVAPMMDALLFVVAEGYTRRDHLIDARQLLEEFNVLGTILNKSVETDSRKDYYY